MVKDSGRMFDENLISEVGLVFPERETYWSP